MFKIPFDSSFVYFVLIISSISSPREVMVASGGRKTMCRRFRRTNAFHCPCRQGFDSSVGCFRRPHCLFIGFHQCKQVADAGRARSHSAHNAGDPCHKNSYVLWNSNTNRLSSRDYLCWVFSDKFLIIFWWICDPMGRWECERDCANVYFCLYRMNIDIE